jgi:cytochrome c
MKKCAGVVAICMSLFFSLVHSGLADEKATPQEVYQKVNQAAAMIQQLGPDGLKALSDTKEFVWKDSYVWAVNCAEHKVAAHPDKKLIGLDLRKIYDKNPDPSKRKLHNLEMCAGADKPYGVWVEYWWNKLGQKEPARKIGFMIKVPGQPYEVTAGIYDDTTSIATLEKTMR